MNRSSLYIDGKDTPMAVDINLPTTYKIADIREPDKRDADITLTLEIPSTKIIDETFEFIFEVNVSLQNFNPNLKTPVVYFINDEPVLTGNLRLSRMLVHPLTNDVTYYCDIKGQLSTLFYDIGEKYLTGNINSSDDLDFSIYDHDLSKTNVSNTWSPLVSPNKNKVSGVDTTVVAGIGYRYPLIDYGLNGGDINNFYVHHLRPGMFAYEYLKKIFEKAGKTWTSTFLESTFFKNKMIPCSEILESDPATLANRQCFVGTSSGITVITTSLLNAGTPTFEWLPTVLPVTPLIVMPNDSGGSYTDAGNIYDTSLGEITVPVKNNYTVSYQFDLYIDISSSVTNYYVDTCNYVFYLTIEMWTGSWTTAYTSPSFSATGYTNSTISETVSGSYQGTFDPGTKFRLRITGTVNNVIFRLFPGGSLITTGTAQYRIDIDPYLAGVSTLPYFALTLDSNNIYEDDLLEINKTIPRKVKQKDFLKSILTMFNLYVLPDKNNTNNYFIEPRNTFYNTNYVDWTDKLDAEKGIEIIPMGELDAKQFTFKYTPGGDYYNKDYQDVWQEVYGEKTFEAENEFVTGEKVQSIIFSPSPLIGNNTNGLLIPKIYKNQNGVVTQQRDNIRILNWAGAVPISRGSWLLYSAITNTVTNNAYYPYAGHLDDPYNPTFDLSFGVPEYIYFSILGYTYPTVNLYTEYHSDFINKITDKSAKIIKAYFNLDEIDIRDFDFRKRVYVKDAYYLVNAIKDFDRLENKTTEVELLKLE